MILQLGEHPKALGVTFKVQEVLALGLAHVIQPTLFIGLVKPVADGIFTGVPIGRVANIVGQAGGLDDDTQISRFAPGGQGLAEHFTNPHAQ